MSYPGATTFAAAWRSVGVDAEVVPPSDDQTLALAAPYLSGDECLPQKVTLGDLLKIARRPDFDPDRTAFFFATTGGPCRFGQYISLFRKVFREAGHGEVTFIAPTSDDSYQGVGREVSALPRLAWQAVVSADILQKLLLSVRPYEVNGGETDRVFEESLGRLCKLIERPTSSPLRRRSELVASLTDIRERFRRVPVRPEARPLIGVVGEIFCRLNGFSNQEVIRRLEGLGGEAWLSDVSEWVWYCNHSEAQRLALRGKRLSFAMLGVILRDHVQRADEHALYAPFRDEFRGREEPERVTELLDRARPYLPSEGAMGEMVLSLGKAIYLYEKGVDGVIDVSPFTCMNGIVSQALYPKVSRDHRGFSVKNFFFDGSPATLDRDLEIFLELAWSYRARRRLASPLRLLPRVTLD
ncbi:MAG: hypothetical protein ACE5JD_05705 [Candidatus Methylomirabilia bacterium]